MLTDFKNFFTDRLSSKYAVKLSLNISPRMCCYTTLWNICAQKVTVFKNWAKQSAMQDSTADSSC